MNEIALLIGILGLAGLLIAFVRALKENKYDLLKLMIFFVFFTVLLLVPKALVDNNDYCETMLNETVEVYNYDAYNYTQNITTSHSYDRVCFTNTKNTSDLFFKITMWLFRVLWFAVFMYLLHYIYLKTVEWVAKKRKGK